MRTIRVTGNGLLEIAPDTTRITISLHGLYPEYGDALRHSSEDSSVLREMVFQLGFQKTDLKTLSFDIDARYESYRDDRGDFHQRLLGYEFTHVMKLEFPNDRDRLGTILYTLAHGKLTPEFSISYTIADPEAAKNEVLARAVSDSRAKAEVICQAAGVQLLAIESIDYSWGQINLEVSPMRDSVIAEKCMSLPTASYDMDIEPDDISIRDTVTVIWEIQ